MLVHVAIAGPSVNLLTAYIFALPIGLACQVKNSRWPASACGVWNAAGYLSRLLQRVLSGARANSHRFIHDHAIAYSSERSQST
jgi:hypothetical protein